MSFFDPLIRLPEDPILSIPGLFAADPRSYKVNLGVGSYRDAEGLPYLLSSVKEAENVILQKEQSKEYLPIEGDPQFLKLVKLLIYGEVLAEKKKEIFITQTLGGTGALAIGGHLLAQGVSQTIYLPDPTWPNHQLIFTRCGLNVLSYTYYDEVVHEVNFSLLKKEVSEMEPGSILLLHACCHNPTGIDLEPDQWRELSLIIKSKHLIPFFDFAYQGFKMGLEEDAFPVRLFLLDGHEFLVANSFAKNFALYGERVGVLSVVLNDQTSILKVGSQLRQIIRSLYSTPPRHGAEVVAQILSHQELKKSWMNDLTNMRVRLKEMRHTLAASLQAKAIHQDWSFLNRQNGFFSFCGLNEDEVGRMIKEFGIYMTSNGRINVGGLNSHNIDYVVQAILKIKHS